MQQRQPRVEFFRSTHIHNPVIYTWCKSRGKKTDKPSIDRFDLDKYSDKNSWNNYNSVPKELPLIDTNHHKDNQNLTKQHHVHLASQIIIISTWIRILNTVKNQHFIIWSNRQEDEVLIFQSTLYLFWPNVTILKQFWNWCLTIVIIFYQNHDLVDVIFVCCKESE